MNPAPRPARLRTDAIVDRRLFLLIEKAVAVGVKGFPSLKHSRRGLGLRNPPVAVGVEPSETLTSRRGVGRRRLGHSGLRGKRRP